jgi:hypothetical protein
MICFAIVGSEGSKKKPKLHKMPQRNQAHAKLQTALPISAQHQSSDLKVLGFSHSLIITIHFCIRYRFKEPNSDLICIAVSRRTCSSKDHLWFFAGVRSHDLVHSAQQDSVFDSQRYLSTFGAQVP